MTRPRPRSPWRGRSASANVVAIPGASSVEQVEANAAAADLELTDDETWALSQASAAFDHVTGLAAARGLLREKIS